MSNVVHRFVHGFKYKVIPWYTSLGFSKGTVTLEMGGRKTGKPIRVSLTIVRHRASGYLVSLYDKSQWVKNVRAADGRAAIISGGKTPVRLVEIPRRSARQSFWDMFGNGPSAIRVKNLRSCSSALAQNGWNF